MAEEKSEELPPPTDVKCPACNAGVFAPAKGRYGLYWRCNNSETRCRVYLPTRPTGAICQYKRGATADAVCGALMVEGTKTIPDRCSDKSCPNRNPHKL